MIANKPNGNVIVATYNDIIEFDAALENKLSHFAPLGEPRRHGPTAMALDKIGRIHLVTQLEVGETPPTTSGALQKRDTTLQGGYYAIIDCDAKSLVYATQVSSFNYPPMNLFGTRFYDIAVDGLTAYIAGNHRVGGQGFPVTPTAYNDAGTATVSGYDISIPPNANPTYGVPIMLAFNIPAFKAGTNTLTAPAITTFCAGAGAMSINGSKATYITPTVLGKADANPAPVPVHYQWQIATNAAGPWTDIPDSDREDWTPAAPATPGQYFYRRLVRQTPFGKNYCVPDSDETQTSNVVTLTFSNNKTHTTDIPDGKYGLCKGSAALPLSYTLTPSADGNQGPYTYKLTTFSNLTATALSQSGTVSAAPGTISLSVGVPGDYILQVTDSRGCTSFDTLTVETISLDAGPDTKFTCGAATVKLADNVAPPTYLNYPTNSFAWSPTTGLDNASSLSPTFTHGLAAGASTMKYLTFNGCRVDTVTIVNQTVNPLPALPALTVCQGEVVYLGTSGPQSATILGAQAGVSYEWAPGLGLTQNDVPNPAVTTLSAPQGVNPITYTVLATAGNTGCVQSTTQKLTIYREPNQSFNLKDCMKNGCTRDSTLKYSAFGTDPEPGISYSWTARVIDDPANGSSNPGLPTNAQALAFLSSTTASKVTLDSRTPGLGYASKYGYKIIYVRTSYNTAKPNCMRTDTAELYYCCGSGVMCELALGNVPKIACGGPDNKIGPGSSSPGGLYYWSRLDGKTLNNELFDINTKQPLSNTGPHPFQVIANPSGLTAVDYRLTWIRAAGTGGFADTCRIDIKVFPGAVAKPNINYSSPQAVCQDKPYTIQGPAQQPALQYRWSPVTLLQNASDSTKALPTLKGLSANTSAYVTVTDPSTTCFVRDTVELVVSTVDVSAGNDASFCKDGATVDIGTQAPLAGYTYQWTASPATGVTFGDATKPKTTVTLPAKAVGTQIKLYLTATNAANCTLRDSVIMTSAATPTVSIPDPNDFCSGGQVTIGPVSPTGTGITYTWTGTGIVSGQGTPTITVNAAGVFQVTVRQGTCSATASQTVVAATLPTVNLAPAAPCNGDVTIGATTMTAAQKVGWMFSWNKYDYMTGSATDLSTITVRPPVTTTYTLTATHVSGCVRTFNVVVPAAAYVATLPGTLNVCEGQTLSLSLNQPTGGGTVTWTASSAAALGYLSNRNSFTPSINVAAAAAGTYSYTATVTYGTGCVDQATVQVNIGKKIGNLAGPDRSVCAGNCVTIGSNSVIGMSYDWSVSPSDAGSVISPVSSPLVCPKVSSVYKLSYTDRAGCKFTDEVFVEVKPVPSLSVVSPQVVCQNATGTASLDLATAITTNTGGTPTYWLNAGATVPTTNPVSFNGTYYIVSTGVNGCTAVQPVSVSFTAPPVATVTATYECNTRKGVLEISTASTGSLTYDYTTGSTYTGTKSYSTATPLTGGRALITGLATDNGLTYTVRVFGATGNCFSDYTVTAVDNCAIICVTPSSLSATATPGSTAPGAIVTLNTTGSGLTAGTTYTWSGPGISSPTASTATSYTIAAPMTAGVYTYTVVVSNGTNCTATTTASLTVMPCSMTVTATPGGCVKETGEYSVRGTITLTNAVAGTASISDAAASTTVTIPAGATSVPFILTGLTANGASRTVTVTLPGCGTVTATYISPSGCSCPTGNCYPTQVRKQN